MDQLITRLKVFTLKCNETSSFRKKVILMITLFAVLVSCTQSDSKRKVNNSSDFKKETISTDRKKETPYNVTQRCKADTISLLNETTECEYCDIRSLKELGQSQEKPDEKEFLKYLICCNEKCHRDIEYAQASNYSLFLFFQYNAKILISVIRDNEKALDINYISFMLQNPVEESINIDATYSALAELENKDTLVENFLGSLKIAMSKATPPSGPSMKEDH
jgi:hypothetical protein